MGGDLYALDFDGVLCDSCGESSISALKAAKIRWPALFEGVSSELDEWIIDQMRIVSFLVFLQINVLFCRLKFRSISVNPFCYLVSMTSPGRALWLRPVVETGYENLLLVRLLLEIQEPFVRKSSVAEGLTVEAILEKWSELKPVIMKEWDEESSDLITVFGSVRDEWMDKDLSGWIDANRFYPGIADALRFASSAVYIVTTKQSRFADALLRKLAGVTIPAERIYGLGTGPKVEVLKKLQAMPEHQNLKLHFVEDRLTTLKNVIKETALDGWNLYLGNILYLPLPSHFLATAIDDLQAFFTKLSTKFINLQTGRWGYNTEKEREEAKSISRIQLLDLSDFSSKLK
ncbi:hypothetical protein IEQ34_007575 [Dendrobium chrysotoxum]|uniref:Uncharacterized protein n=1 Tax=Dendrobium chrysotoxum TaxID=161865 RepID=A0AAV7H5Q5_DENCH|nr:hypothetical protein IEQ34_007575 [Dendrobium chrysotoxum]